LTSVAYRGRQNMFIYALMLDFGIRPCTAVVSIVLIGYGFLFAFHSNYGRIFSRFDTIYERYRHPSSQTPSHRTTARAAAAASLGCSGAAMIPTSSSSSSSSPSLLSSKVRRRNSRFYECPGR